MTGLQILGVPDIPEITAGVDLAAIIADGTYKTIFETYFPGVPVPAEYGG